MSPPARSPFAEDDGSADPRLLAALAEPDEQALMRALAASRVLLPVVPLPPGHSDADHDHDDHGHDGHGDDDHGHDHESPGAATMATVSLVAPDGRRGMLAFSGLAALRAWDPGARPLPAVIREAARTALDSGFDAMVIDPRSGHERTVRPSMLWSLVGGWDWLPAHSDPVVQAAVRAAVAGDPRIRAADLADGPPGTGTLVVRLGVQAGLTDDDLAALVTGIGEQLAGDPQVRVRLDDVSVRLQP